MSPVVVSGLTHECARDGHMIAVRLNWDIDIVKVTPFCEFCHLIFLPSASMSGRHAAWLMKQVENARWTPEAPPEAYDGMYA